MGNYCKDVEHIHFVNLFNHKFIRPIVCYNQIITFQKVVNIEDFLHFEQVKFDLIDVGYLIFKLRHKHKLIFIKENENVLGILKFARLSRENNKISISFFHREETKVKTTRFQIEVIDYNPRLLLSYDDNNESFLTLDDLNRFLKNVN